MMNYMLGPLRKKFNLSLRFMREIPRLLLSKERGHEIASRGFPRDAKLDWDNRPTVRHVFCRHQRRSSLRKATSRHERLRQVERGSGVS
jgi:hypothetical protein